MIFKSKKATLTIIGVALMVVLALVGQSDPNWLIALVLWSYNIGQGIADHGKHRLPILIEGSRDTTKTDNDSNDRQ